MAPRMDWLPFFNQFVILKIPNKGGTRTWAHVTTMQENQGSKFMYIWLFGQLFVEKTSESGIWIAYLQIAICEPTIIITFTFDDTDIFSIVNGIFNQVLFVVINM